MNAPIRWPFRGLQRFDYDFGMIDPPWSFELWSDKGQAKSPQAQYECMELDEIAAMPMGELFREHAGVWLWCTWPLLVRGDHLELLRRWNLTPVTGGAWAKRTRRGKLRWGPGFVIRSVCEPFIIARRGSDLKLRGTSVANLIDHVAEHMIDGLAREHSRKPDEAYFACEKLAPAARRCDVFSRQRRPGWDSWGREVNKFKAGAAV